MKYRHRIHTLSGCSCGEARPQCQNHAAIRFASVLGSLISASVALSSGS